MSLNARQVTDRAKLAGQNGCNKSQIDIGEPGNKCMFDERRAKQSAGENG